MHQLSYLNLDSRKLSNHQDLEWHLFNHSTSQLAEVICIVSGVIKIHCSIHWMYLCLNLGTGKFSNHPNSVQIIWNDVVTRSGYIWSLYLKMLLRSGTKWNIKPSKQLERRAQPTKLQAARLIWSCVTKCCEFQPTNAARKRLDPSKCACALIHPFSIHWHCPRACLTYRMLVNNVSWLETNEYQKMPRSCSCLKRNARKIPSFRQHWFEVIYLSGVIKFDGAFAKCLYFWIPTVGNYQTVSENIWSLYL